MTQIEINKNLSGEAYRRLIKELATESDLFGYVVRNGISLSNKGLMLLDEMSKFTFSDDQKNEWPGTILLDATARVVIYRNTQESIEKILSASTSLFEWLQPELPEDLFFLSEKTMEPLLTTVAHEGFGIISDHNLSDNLVRTILELK